MPEPYEPPLYDENHDPLRHEERDWPTTPPAERDPKWGYYTTHDDGFWQSNGHRTRHAAIGTAAIFNSRLDGEPYSVEAHKTSGPMYWDTEHETTCSWCGYTTTIRPLVGWEYADHGPYCTQECWVRDWHADGNEVQYEVTLR